MNPFKFLHSIFLLTRTAKYQGRQQFEKVIHMANKAKSLSPNSDYIFYSATLLLGDDYPRIKQYNKAITALDEGLEQFPDDETLNQLMVKALKDKGESIGKYIPYLRTYLQSYEKREPDIPWLVRLIMKILKKDFDIDAYARKLSSMDDEWTIWARKTVKRYDNNQKNRQKL